ncbi:hypothetical protein [Paenibacillus sp. FSL H8-0332]|uniref:hypothetical protein n=1 Tax=Paenibacillus sp. FSL H8-0332 TaxID=2954742 RepID=UPI0030D3BF79
MHNAFRPFINILFLPTRLVPISGILMAAATASTSTGVIVATGSFGQAILNMGTATLVYGFFSKINIIDEVWK